MGTPSGMFSYLSLLQGTLNLEGIRHNGRLCRGWLALQHNWEKILAYLPQYDLNLRRQV